MGLTLAPVVTETKDQLYLYTFRLYIFTNRSSTFTLKFYLGLQVRVGGLD